MDKGTRKLLIVDDDESLRRQLRWAFDDLEVVLAENRETAIATMQEHRTPVALLDLGLPPDPHGPTEGLATLEALLSEQPGAKVIMMSGQTQREYAVQAVARGAYDFYQKPIEVETLNLIIQRAFHVHDLEEENRRLAMAEASTPVPGLITTNAEMIQLCADLRKFAQTDVTVLLLGESGTGKEVLARAVHQLSNRRKGPFTAINCAAIPDHLLESELFGHEKGAFTGAVRTTQGKVELASGGTLFLDEIGDLPLPLQAKLFRFLQERVIERIGGRREIAVDIRIVSATNKDLQKRILEGTFREELFYRLAETVINIPPLRVRPDDTVVIAHHFLHTMSSELGRNLKGFDTAALAAISSYEWPGNVRELENRIKRAVVTASGHHISIEDLDLPVNDIESRRATLKQSREKAERQAIARAMTEAEGNVSRAAKILDVSRPTLYQLLREYGVKH